MSENTPHGARADRSAPRDDVSPTELVVLKALWERGPSTVREVDELLRRDGKERAYTTISTLLQRLEAKGYVTTDTETTPHVFRAEVARSDLLVHRLRAIAEQLTDGAASPLVQCLVANERFSPEELARLRRLIEDGVEGEVPADDAPVDTPKPPRRRRGGK